MIHENKDRKTDRTLVLKVIDGQRPLTSMGMVDPRILTGGNELHAIQDPKNLLWSFRWRSGGLAEPMKQKFTTFDTLLNFAKVYFKNRNLEVKEILD